MSFKIEHYPTNKDAPYYLEFQSTNLRIDRITWQLFQRNYIMSREVHPWNLGEGIVEEDPHIISMNTRNFLTFMVDSLNKNSVV